MLQNLLNQLETRNDIQNFLLNAKDTDTIRFEFDGTSFRYTPIQLVETINILQWAIDTYSADL